MDPILTEWPVLGSTQSAIVTIVLFIVFNPPFGKRLAGRLAFPESCTMIQDMAGKLSILVPGRHPPGRTATGSSSTCFRNLLVSVEC